LFLHRHHEPTTTGMLVRCACYCLACLRRELPHLRNRSSRLPFYFIVSAPPFDYCCCCRRRPPTCWRLTLDGISPPRRLSTAPNLIPFAGRRRRSRHRSLPPRVRIFTTFLPRNNLLRYASGIPLGWRTPCRAAPSRRRARGSRWWRGAASRPRWGCCPAPSCRGRS